MESPLLQRAPSTTPITTPLKFSALLIGIILLYDSVLTSFKMSTLFTTHFHIQLVPFDRFTIGWVVITTIASLQTLYSFMTCPDSNKLLVSAFMMTVSLVVCPFMVLVQNDLKEWYGLRTVIELISVVLSFYAFAKVSNKQIKFE